MELVGQDHLHNYDTLSKLGLSTWWTDRTGARLSTRLNGLRVSQREIVEWALSRPEPYLLVNAPTGIGKTLSGGIFAAAHNLPWTYAVSTKSLQDQVSGDLGVPTLKGRDNFACLIGQSTHGFDISAARGKCVFSERCTHDGTATLGDMCDYYKQKSTAFASKGRVTNYAMALSMPEMRMHAGTLICDEAHRIESTVISNASVLLNRMSALHYRFKIPYLGDDPLKWAQWAKGKRVNSKGKYDGTAKKLNEALETIRSMARNPRNWVVEDRQSAVRFTPIFGSDYVLGNLFGHSRSISTDDILEGETGRKPISRVLMMSATLLAPDLMEKTLGLPSHSYAYLDLPSPFDPSHRPVNYAPVMGMNARVMATAEGRRPMQEAMDKLIEHYLLNGSKCGIIHSVSRAYREEILAESRWKGVMTSDPLVHRKSSEAGSASVLVSDNIIDGWDGTDDLCRFVLMPKVPFANLGDKHVQARNALDDRSLDYHAIISVVQGVGRGVRHSSDYADSWILDSNWGQLMGRRKHWLPKSFLDAYRHGVSIN